LLHREGRPEYARALREMTGAPSGKAPLRPAPLPALFSSALERPFRLVIAGSAGGKVRSTARMIGEAAVLSGLWAAQQDDYPVTVQTGHSISELILSPREILFTGVSRPDALVLISEEGRKAAGRYLAALTEGSWLFTTPELAGIETPARKVVFDFAAAGVRASRRDQGLLMAGAALRMLDLFPIEACEEAIRRGQRSAIAEENLELLRRSAAVVTLETEQRANVV
jgi:Pyruvate/2-oxoacid:ferredoxin oxidoreductase gamma subunit